MSKYSNQKLHPTSTIGYKSKSLHSFIQPARPLLLIITMFCLFNRNSFYHWTSCCVDLLHNRASCIIPTIQLYKSETTVYPNMSHLFENKYLQVFNFLDHHLCQRVIIIYHNTFFPSHKTHVDADIL